MRAQVSVTSEGFVVERFVTHPPAQRTEPVILEREWGTETILVETERYMLKRLDMKQSKPGGLQFHVEKDEAFTLAEGLASVEWQDEDGLIQRWGMVPGQTFHIPPGAIHRVTPTTDCVFYEASTPHHNDRVHVESEHGQDETGGLPSTWESDDGVKYRRKEAAG